MLMILLLFNLLCSGFVVLISFFLSHFNSLYHSRSPSSKYRKLLFFKIVCCITCGRRRREVAILTNIHKFKVCASLNAGTLKLFIDGSMDNQSEALFDGKCLPNFKGEFTIIILLTSNSYFISLHLFLSEGIIQSNEVDGGIAIKAVFSIGRMKNDVFIKRY